MVSNENAINMHRLKTIVSSNLGLAIGYDEYYFLARIGDNYKNYSFAWEPFRDVAGPLLKSQDSKPILIVSENSDIKEPTIFEEIDPFPHYQFKVSPNCPSTIIANSWLELLVDNGALHGNYKGPFDWFVTGLELDVGSLSNKARKFLML